MPVVVIVRRSSDVSKALIVILYFVHRECMVSLTINENI